MTMAHDHGAEAARVSAWKPLLLKRSPEDFSDITHGINLLIGVQFRTKNRRGRAHFRSCVAAVLRSAEKLQFGDQ